MNVHEKISAAAVTVPPAAWFVTTESGPSWLVFTDPQTGTRLNAVRAPVWNERMHLLETAVADETAVAFDDLETRIAADSADQQALFDAAASSWPSEPTAGLLRRLWRRRR